jgi:hypothetical protein
MPFAALLIAAVLLAASASPAAQSAADFDRGRALAAASLSPSPRSCSTRRSTRAARFDPLAYPWIGRLATFTTFGVAWHAAPVQSIAEAKTKELILGAVGPSGPP